MEERYRIKCVLEIILCTILDMLVNVYSFLKGVLHSRLISTVDFGKGSCIHTCILNIKKNSACYTQDSVEL